jgi:EAL domain-containing protein (putative c-di-GMP-specific phosphodiesterase class I)
MLCAMLTGSGVDVEAFPSTRTLAEALKFDIPDVVILDVPSEAETAIDVLFLLGACGFRGPVQLMGLHVNQVVRTVKRTGERHALQMLPPLRKPIDMLSLQAILEEQGLAGEPRPDHKVELGEALRNDWIEYWYQPKVDLLRRKITGVEAFARVHHPQFGTLPPGAFMPGADEASLMRLAEFGLLNALGAAESIATLGINLRIAINVPAAALASLPIADMVRDLGPKSAPWAGLILDVTEAQIAPDVALIGGISEQLALYNIKLAIDDFGRGQLSVAHLRDISFAELKLDGNFVNDCGRERSNADVCKSVIDLAHSFGCTAVAIGLEKASDLRALLAMGCDVGHGSLFGHAMSEDAFFALLRQRAKKRSR